MLNQEQQVLVLQTLMKWKSAWRDIIWVASDVTRSNFTFQVINSGVGCELKDAFNNVNWEYAATLADSFEKTEFPFTRYREISKLAYNLYSCNSYGQTLIEKIQQPSTDIANSANRTSKLVIQTNPNCGKKKKDEPLTIVQCPPTVQPDMQPFPNLVTSVQDKPIKSGKPVRATKTYATVTVAGVGKEDHSKANSSAVQPTKKPQIQSPCDKVLIPPTPPPPPPSSPSPVSDMAEDSPKPSESHSSVESNLDDTSVILNSSPTKTEVDRAATTEEQADNATACTED